jgi:hydroxymethylpyrimidine/phosphomethylpyrimidine kinase
VPTILAVCAELRALAPAVPLVADPVMVAKGGHRLLAEDAVATLMAELLPLASIITPNIPEAEVLSGITIRDEADMHAAAAKLLSLGVRAVLLKGGHMEGETLTDLLVTRDGVTRFDSARIASRHTHGTGCTLASAIAAGLAQGMAMLPAVARARAYVRAAMLAAPGLGAGHGPLNHGITLDPGRLAAL